MSFPRPSGIVHSQSHTPDVPDSETLLMHDVATTHTSAFIFPPPSESVRSLPIEHMEQPRDRAETPSSSLFNLTESISTLDARPLKPFPQSNLSILMARHGSPSPTREHAADEDTEDIHTPVVSEPRPVLYRPFQSQQNTLLPPPRSTASPRSLSERTPLLQLSSFPESHYPSHKWVAHAKSATTQVVLALPAVVLGLLLNILDGISCTSRFTFISSGATDHGHVVHRWHDHLSCYGRLY